MSKLIKIGIYIVVVLIVLYILKGVFTVLATIIYGITVFALAVLIAILFVPEKYLNQLSEKLLILRNKLKEKIKSLIK
jgi:hypothetical protein